MNGWHLLIVLAAAATCAYFFDRWQRNCQHLERLRAAMRALARDINRNPQHAAVALRYIGELVELREDAPMPEAPPVAEPIRLVKSSTQKRR